MTGTYLARRCCLSVPGGDERKIERASESDADEIVLDLEDSVPPGAKEDARAAVAKWLASASRPGVAIRVNAPRTPWCHEDIVACAQPGGPERSIVVPKVESAGDLAFVDRLLDGVEHASGRETPVTVQALIETATGLANLAEIVTASPRLRTVILGYADLGASLGRSAAAGLDTWLPAQHSVLVAARSAGIAAIDGPYLAVDTGAEFAASVERAARLGFDGKWAIHPRQIEPILTAFTPTAEEIAYAQRILDALGEAHGRGVGAISVDGQMIDEALAVSARRTLARA
ncbi:CoA ester lyase [Amycolatopsis sp.]|uniref:HpcH/HpaI aldolase/citrate lyase family protein n=1 Tax=Amycolatopsis sp. TaxID=37632 RepID=UPI002E086032|nr:CoA ester lyase [Amycolatopsis sp.]